MDVSAAPERAVVILDAVGPESRSSIQELAEKRGLEVCDIADAKARFPNLHETLHITEPHDVETAECQTILRSHRRLVGVRIFEFCVRTCTPFPPPGLTVMSFVMKGIVVCGTHLERQDKDVVRQLVTYMGGEVCDHFTTDTTHLTSRSNGSRKYRLAVQRGIPVVSPDWVTACWEARRLVPYHGYHAHKLTVGGMGRILVEGQQTDNQVGEHEFEERLDVCKKGSCALVFPRGAHESGPQFKTRLTNQLKARRPILPKSADEPEKGFAERCKLQLLAERVVHPYDSSREDEHLYFRRLNAHRERTALAFEPGDKAALNSALGPEKKPQEDEGRERAATSETAAELMRKAEEEAKARREEEVKAADADAEKLRLEKAAEEAAAMEEERVAQRIADMKAKAKEAQQAAEAELERKKSFSTEQININAIGFMPLKKLLMERGVPKDQVFACANKFALQEVAKKWADELKIEWVTE